MPPSLLGKLISRGANKPVGELRQSWAPLSPVETALTDDVLVERVLAGETRLFEVVLRRNNQRLYRTARAILRDEVEAEDVMQAAYVQAFAHLADFQRRASLSTWLTRIAVHEALARLRRRRRFETVDENPEADESMNEEARAHQSPEDIAADGELRRVLERAIDTLPDNFREVFVLRAVEELSVAETAACLSIPEDTVKTRLFRARALLQKVLLDEAVPQAFTFLGPRCDRVVASVFARILG
jgi:RNA polymerase sigma-70 factor (ECF subfamily)